MKSGARQSRQICPVPQKDRAVFSASGRVETCGRATTAPQGTHVQMHGHPVRILLAEDNPADVFLFRLALTDYPVPTELTVVADGAAVLELLLSEGGFDILFLDLNLPRVGGEEVLWKLSAASGAGKPAIPVVVFSAVSVKPSDAPGADACIVKPEGLEEYLKAVRHLCDTWLTPMAARSSSAR